MDRHRQQGLEIKVARILNTYGPRRRPTDGRAVSNAAMQSLTRAALDGVAGAHAA